MFGYHFCFFFIRNTTKDKEAAEYIDDDNLQLDHNEDYLYSLEVCLYINNIQNLEFFLE